jgi:actin-related protein
MCLHKHNEQQFSEVRFVPEPVLIAISAHRPTCMIIQIGEDTTTVSIVWENELLPQSVVVIQRGDADVTRYSIYIYI